MHGEEVSSDATKRNISINDFTIENKILLNISCRRVSSCTRITTVPELWAQIVPCILDIIFLNIG